MAIQHRYGAGACSGGARADGRRGHAQSWLAATWHGVHPVARTHERTARNRGGVELTVQWCDACSSDQHYRPSSRGGCRRPRRRAEGVLKKLGASSRRKQDTVAGEDEDGQIAPGTFEGQPRPAPTSAATDECDECGAGAETTQQLTALGAGNRPPRVHSGDVKSADQSRRRTTIRATAGRAWYCPRRGTKTGTG